MAEEGIKEQEFKTRVELIDGYSFRVEFPGEIGDILTDEPEPVGKGEYPNAGMLLAAAVGNCLCASLAFCLRKARVPVKGLNAEVYARLVRNEKGRLRVACIRVVLHPEVDDLNKFARCSEIFEDFCIVSQSVRRGIDVQVQLEPPPGAGSKPSE